MFLPPSDILLLASYLSHLCFYVSSYLAFFFSGNIIRQTLTKRKLLHGIPAPEVGLHPPTYEYVSKTHGVDYLLSIYDFGLTYLFMDGGELADPMDPKLTLLNIKIVVFVNAYKSSF